MNDVYNGLGKFQTTSQFNQKYEQRKHFVISLLNTLC